MIERAVLLAKGEEIHADDIVIKGSSTTVSVGERGAPIEFMTLDQAEQQLLQQALTKSSGSAIEAAELLGISKSAIYRRMDKYDIKS
jgi:DNA-binding NtrC family response regulator